LLLLADEPTGQLDSDTGQQVVALLRDLVHGSRQRRPRGHYDPALVTLADRVLHLRDGRLEDSP
jgi:putative ABC transport system ATP-binding protein